MLKAFFSFIVDIEQCFLKLFRNKEYFIQVVIFAW